MALLVFAVVLFVAVLVSCLASRSVLSTSVLFLAAGFLAGPGVLGIFQIKATDPVVTGFVELALFSVLFTDGMRVSREELTQAWHLPGRALLLGLPLTLAGTALLAHFLLELPWAAAFLLGAVLSPTDPVFAAAIIGREEVPARLRHLLNVESGFNDGLALPVVIASLAMAGGRDVSLPAVLSQSALGVSLGVALAWAAIHLERSRLFGAAGIYQPLAAFSIGLLILALGRLTHANQMLAAFSGGIAVALFSAELRDAFHHFGELLAELFKLAALLVFGALIHPRYVAEIGLPGWTFLILALVAVRPAALWLALLGGGLQRREWITAAWFGPKGFSSVLFAILVIQSRIPQATRIFHLLALVIAASMVAHSSTDLLVARWLHRASDARDPAPTVHTPAGGAP